MRKVLVFILPVLYSIPLFTQEVLKNEGLVVNNTITGNWGGVNIPRNVPVKLYFQNNSITSVNSSGYLLQAGDEAPLLSNNRLDGALISGNKFVWKGTVTPSIITHGLFYGYNINGLIQYNYLDNVPYGIIFKSGTDAGVNMTFTTGGAAYNIVKNGHFAVRMKGINGVKVYNNTFYSGDQAGWYLVLITENMDRANGAPSLGARLFNNIFYTKYKIPSIKVDVRETFQDFQCDYNLYYCEEGDHKPVFSIGDVEYSWEEWRSLGYDTHSVVLNPDFINTVTFVPRGRLDYGTDLGSEWQSGLSVSAVWTPGTAPATTLQNGIWQTGAVIYTAATSPPPVTPPVTPPPATNTPPVVVVNATVENLSGFVGEIDASASYDAENDRLSFTWTTPLGVSVSSTSTSKIKFLTPVTSSIQTVEFTLKVSDGTATRIQTVPIKIVPYMPDLESAEIADIKASSFQTPNYPYDAVDGDIGTMWSANGDNQWLVMELRETFNVQHVKIAFQPGQKKVSYFDVMGSEDGTNWESILTKSSSCGFSGNLHVFDFPPAKSAVGYRYIKFVGHSNSLDSWNYISEFRIFGFRYNYPGNIQDHPVRLYPNPATAVINVRIDDSGIKPEFVRILNLAGEIVFQDRIEPGIRDFQIPVSFRQGIYIVQMGSGDLTFFSQKIIINA